MSTANAAPNHMAAGELTRQCAQWQRELEGYAWQPAEHNPHQYRYVAPAPIDREVQPSRQRPLWEMREWELCGDHYMRRKCPVTGAIVGYLDFVEADRDARNLEGHYLDCHNNWYTFTRDSYPSVQRGRVPLNVSEGAPNTGFGDHDESHRAILDRPRRRIAC